jgi:hypothetical protein
VTERISVTVGWGWMEEPRSDLWQACHENTYEPGTKKPRDSPSRFEEFDAECIVCHQRIALVLGTDQLKMHYSKLPSKPQTRGPRKWWRLW